MKPRVIFFDAHGGIIDDIETAFRAFQDVFSYFHREPPSISEYLLTLELDGWDMMPQFTRKGITVFAEEIYGLMCQAYALRLRHSDVQLMPGIRELLKIVYKKKILGILLSRYPEDVVSPIIHDADIDTFFGLEMFGEENPEVSIEWALKIENMHTKPSILPAECVFLSPNPFLLLQAKRMGVYTVALIREPIPAYFSRLARPNNEIDDILKLLSIIEKP